jgi:hypothetical protein
LPMALIFRVHNKYMLSFELIVEVSSELTAYLILANSLAEPVGTQPVAPQ